MIDNILASASPRRKTLLNQIGFEFTVIPSKVEENLKNIFPPEAFTEYWARKKAQDVAKDYPNSFVIGADTIVLLDNKILGKPKNNLDSEQMLRSLSGRTHEVITGVSLILLKKNIDITFNNRTYVSISKLCDRDIYNYIENYQPLDKAGSYGIQDGFSIYIKGIKGCYFNVMGFPLYTFNKYYNFLIK